MNQQANGQTEEWDRKNIMPMPTLSGNEGIKDKLKSVPQGRNNRFQLIINHTFNFQNARKNAKEIHLKNCIYLSNSTSVLYFTARSAL